MVNALLEAGIEIDFIDDIYHKSQDTPLDMRLKDMYYQRLLKGKSGKYIPFYEPFTLKAIGKEVSDKLKGTNAEIVFSPGAIPISYLDTNLPIVMWSDATFAVMHNYYSQFSGFCKSTVKSCHAYERNVMKRLAIAIFSSEWAAQSAIKDYGAKKEQVRIISYGANIAETRNWADIKPMIKSRGRELCRLLFIGQDWYRKGGNTAVEVAKKLKELGTPVELTIVGCNPPDGTQLPDYIKVKGFIDKSKPEGSAYIEKLYSESHFFLLPTIAECTPIVFSEANSYGMPVITTNTGGIPSVIRDEVNGKMFGNNMAPEECAAYLQNCFNEPERYDQFAESSFNEYIERLNWKVSIRKVIDCFRELKPNN